MRNWIVSLVLSAVTLVPAAAMSQETPEYYESVRSFLEQTPPGQLAIAVGAKNERGARRATRILVLKPGERNTVSRSNALYFIINHMSKDGDSNNAGYFRLSDPETFIAIKMHVTYKDEGTGSSMYLYRNAGWTRWGKHWNGAKKRISTDELNQPLYNKSISRFAELHHQGDLSKVDEFLENAPFHAAPTDAKFNSWDSSRDFWAEEGGFCPDNLKTCSLKALLLKFSEASSSDSSNVPIFYSNPYGVKEIKLWTTSPAGEEYNLFYTIEIKDN